MNSLKSYRIINTAGGFMRTFTSKVIDIIQMILLRKVMAYGQIATLACSA